MTDNFNSAYTLLYFRVLPLTMKGYLEKCLIGDFPVPDRSVRWHLDKVKALGKDYPIPSNFHLVHSDLPQGVFAYELVLTYENTPYPIPLSESITQSVLCIWPFRIHPKSIRACWLLLSDEPLSVHQTEWIVEQYAGSFHPLDHPTLLGYELVGVWKG